MDTTPESTDSEEEEDWMAINWDSKSCPATSDQSVLSCPATSDQSVSSCPATSDQSVSSCPATSDQSVSGKDVPNTKDTKSDEVLMSRMLLNDNKAGMTGFDKEQINQIIFEASKGSKYFENERKKEEQVTKRIEEQKQKMKDITQEQLDFAEKEADLLLEEFDRLRDLSKTIIHIDMDAFYAAVEMRDNPALRDKPMAVGGNSMLSTSNYHARKFGVRAAMPGFIGKKLCPELVIVPTHFDKYTSVSKQVKAILAVFDPDFCTVSLDEAYLDFTDHMMKRSGLSDKERTVICRKCDSFDKSFCLCDLNETFGVSLSEDETIEVKVKAANVCTDCGKPVPEFEIVTFGTTLEEAVKEMRCRIHQKTCLTASAGIAPNMMLAKVCSDMNKPNGQYKIPSTVEAVMSFIRELPIRKISGIGKVSERMLNAVGVRTCQDLCKNRGLLYHLYSRISFNYFMRICLGIGSTSVERDGERKSMSTERTFPEMSVPAELYSKCLELCQALAEDLQADELKGKTVAIKIKTVKFDVKTRACSLPDYTSDPEVIYVAAKDLLCKEIKNVHPQPLKLRLMGVRMSSLMNQNLVVNKKKQNTLMQFVKKEEKAGKSDTQHWAETHSEEMEKAEGKNPQCSEVPILNSEQNSCVVEQITPCHSDYNGEDKRIENSHSTSADEDMIQRTSASVTKRAEDTLDTFCIETCESGKPQEEQMLSGDCNATADSLDEKSKTVWYTCPVCRDEIGCSDLHGFNHHIDTCLSRSLVKECSQYRPEEDTPRTKKTNRKTSTPKYKSTSSNKLKSSLKTPSKTLMTKPLDPGPPESDERPSISNTQKNVNSNTDVDKLAESEGCRGTEPLVCPVCFMEQASVDLDTFNEHVDSCLCKGTITEILKEQKQDNKRSFEMQGARGSAVKRKRQESGPKSQSIASYFQVNT